MSKTAFPFLGDLVNIKTGKLDANEADENGKYPFFTCSIEPLRINTPAFDCNAILVAGNGDLNVKHYNGKFNAYQRTYVITCKDETILNTRYLFHFMDKYVEQLRLQSIGGVIKYIKLGNLTDAKIPLPPLPEQRRIAAILDTADIIRQKRKAAIAKLDELALSVFQSITSNEKAKKGISNVKISEISEIDYGYTESASENPIGPHFLRITDLHEDGVDWEQVPYCSIADNKISRYRLYDGDIVFARTGATTGKSFLVRNPPESVFASYLIRLKTTEKNASPEYISYYFKSPQYWQSISLGVSGSAQGGFNATKLGDLNIPLPSLSAQKDFSMALTQIQKVRMHHQTALTSEELLFSSLQHRAFAGEL